MEDYSLPNGLSSVPNAELELVYAGRRVERMQGVQDGPHIGASAQRTGDLKAQGVIHVLFQEVAVALRDRACRNSRPSGRL
jgi:hypothetical protein